MGRTNTRRGAAADFVSVEDPSAEPVKVGKVNLATLTADATMALPASPADGDSATVVVEGTAGKAVTLSAGGGKTIKSGSERIEVGTSRKLAYVDADDEWSEPVQAPTGISGWVQVTTDDFAKYNDTRSLEDGTPSHDTDGLISIPIRNTSGLEAKDTDRMLFYRITRATLEGWFPTLDFSVGGHGFEFVFEPSSNTHMEGIVAFGMVSSSPFGFGAAVGYSRDNSTTYRATWVNSTGPGYATGSTLANLEDIVRGEFHWLEDSTTGAGPRIWGHSTWKATDGASENNAFYTVDNLNQDSGSHLGLFIGTDSPSDLGTQTLKFRFWIRHKFIDHDPR